MDVPDYRDRKCGDCAHWCKLENRTSVAMNAKPVGECRATPPTMTLVTVQGRPSTIALYPQVTCEHSACSQFKDTQTINTTPSHKEMMHG